MLDLKDISIKKGREITGRFFEAVYALIEKKAIKNKSEIANALQQQRSNFNSLESHATRMVQPCMCEYLVSKYKVDGTWLLTGIGSMFRKDNITLEIPEDQITNIRRTANRLFKAVDRLELERKIDSAPQAFVQMGYTKSAYATIKADETKGVSLYALYYLVNRHRINGTWLLSEIGDMKR